MPIHEKGFFSKDIISWIQKHRMENQEYFLLCEDLNRFFHKMLYDHPLRINNHNRQQLLVASLSLRALSTFQSIIILAERGLTADGKILLRSLMEVLFRACAIVKKDGVAEIYILQDKIHRKSIGEKLKKLSERIKETEVNSAELEEGLKTLDQRIKEDNIKKYSVEWFAQQAGLSDFYNSAYSFLSQAVHANVGELDEYLETNAAGKVAGLTYGPDVKGIDFLLIGAIESMVILASHFINLFKLPLDTRVEVFRSRLNDLGKRYLGSDEKGDSPARCGETWVE